MRNMRIVDAAMTVGLTKTIEAMKDNQSIRLEFGLRVPEDVAQRVLRAAMDAYDAEYIGNVVDAEVVK